MKLTAMTRNALYICAWGQGLVDDNDESYKAGLTKLQASQLTYESVKNADNIGKLGLRDIVLWLAEDGLELKNSPSKRRVSESKIRDAVKLLEKEGFTVIEPKER